MTNPGWTFQWRNNAVDIPGATNSTYVLNTTVSCAISCRVANACGSVTSNAISVTVQNPPNPLLTFGNTNICSGSYVSISVTTGSGQTYQWRKNGAVLAGVTSSTYLATSTGVYDAVVTNACGSFPSSNQANVVVTSAPPAAITANGPTTFCPGGSVTLLANTGTGLTYAWRQNGTAIPGATNVFYQVTAWGLYDCIVSNNCGSANSNQINVTVSNPPTATIVAGGPTTFCQGGSVTISVTPGNGWTYQWKQNGNAISGATGTSYVAIASGGYTCTVSNNCGSVTSNPVNVVVNTVPVAGAISGQSSNVCNTVKTYTIAPASGATSYVWTVPSGAAISSGQGTININVTFSSSFGGGAITVTASNNCGTGPTSGLNVEGAPGMPGNITGLVSVCQHQNNVTYSISAVSGATSYTWTVPPGAQIKSGQGTTIIKVRFGTSAGNITVTADNACGSGAARSLAIAMPCREGEEIAAGVFETKIYPNPSASQFTIEINSSYSETATIRIFDLSGRLFETHEAVPIRKEIQAGENLAPGIYLAEIVSGTQRKVMKLIRQD
jgi:hypothetical protein